MKKIAIGLVIATYLCCNSKETKNSEETIVDQKEEKEMISATPEVSTKSNEAQKWLVKSVNYYFAQEPLPKMSTITTKRYEEYQNDIFATEYDSENSMTIEEFKKKWKDIYNTEPGFNKGFLIDAQDWDKIKVTKCDLKTEKDGYYIFSTVITDEGFKTNYNKEIKIVKENDGYKIDDVINLD